MSPSKVSKRVVSDRYQWIDRMIKEIKSLPLDSYDAFTADKRNVWSAESCLRRALEALMDLGRHILAKGFGRGVSEYREIASGLEDERILSAEKGKRMKMLAGYRNRMVHFYHEMSDRELYQICSSQLDDIKDIATEISRWLKNHPEIMDDTL
ncbi:MAG: DUF86 domain-containing protein [Deltaproteobacteria bacterium]|nr:DUF86 domain-containing protein [Deltaproteobacteria bacterium]MBW2070001.1 DUF86 domain-containing protein [Deltaproteobacteria bacterium]